MTQIKPSSVLSRRYSAQLQAVEKLNSIEKLRLQGFMAQCLRRYKYGVLPGDLLILDRL